MIKYIQLQSKTDLNVLNISKFSPFKAVVIIEEDLEKDRRVQICNWIVDMGCLYMMAWGIECGIWDDIVDEKNCYDFNFKGVPEEKDIMTTWHNNQSLIELFYFSKNLAKHPCIELKNTIIIHVSEEDKFRELMKKYEKA